MIHNETTLSSATLYSGSIVTLRCDAVRLENGNTARREIVEHNGGVAVLAIDNDDMVLFVRQFRYPFRQVLLELPAGKLERGEDPAACGLRELEEETGHTADSYEYLGEVYPTPGYCTEVLYLYTAKQLVPTRQKLDDDEFLTVERIGFDDALRLCMNGGIKDGKTVTAMMKYALQTGRLPR